MAFEKTHFYNKKYDFKATLFTPFNKINFNVMFVE